MTRLAEVKQERDQAKAEAWTQHMCLLLALTTKPDHTERVQLPDDAFRFVIDAYGLTRCNGGYVVVRGICPGQQDSIRGHTFYDWEQQQQTNHFQFRCAAERIVAVQRRLLAAA